MSVFDKLGRALSGPAGQILEPQVRDIVDEVLRQHQAARPEDVDAVRNEVEALKGDLHALSARISNLMEKVTALTEKAANLESGITQALEAARQATKAIDDLQAAAPQAAAPQAAAGAPAAEAPAARAPAAEAPAAEAPAAKAPTAEAPAAKAPTAEAPAAKAPKKTSGTAGKKKTASAKKADKPRGKPGRKSLAHLGCRVAGCKRPHRSKGFCGAHYQAWRRGSLPQFIMPDGTLTWDGKKLKVDKKAAGLTFKVEEKDGQYTVYVGKEKTPFPAEVMEPAAA